MAKKIQSVEDLQHDPRNPNDGTDAGRTMIEESLRVTKAGRSVVADKDGRLIAGNKTVEQWRKMGGKIRVVETDGDELVVVQRTDLDLTDDEGPARRMAYYDNRANELSLKWNPEIIAADQQAGVKLPFTAETMNRIMVPLRQQAATNFLGPFLNPSERTEHGSNDSAPHYDEETGDAGEYAPNDGSAPHNGAQSPTPSYSPPPVPYVGISFPVTTEQRNWINGAMNRAKETLGTTTSTETLIAILERFEAENA